MVSNEIMRNSDVFMRISHFLISLMKTWEKQVIGLYVLKKSRKCKFQTEQRNWRRTSLWKEHHQRVVFCHMQCSIMVVYVGSSIGVLVMVTYTYILAPTTVLDTITFSLPLDPTPKWIDQKFFQPFWQPRYDKMNLPSLLGLKFNPSRLGRFILS